MHSRPTAPRGANHYGLGRRSSLLTRPRPLLITLSWRQTTKARSTPSNRLLVALEWKGRVTASPHAIATAHGVVYVTSGNGELVAFSVAGCGERECNPLWTSAPSGFSLFAPTVANGVVYVGALDFIYTSGDVLAYPATCSEGCQPLAILKLGGANETPLCCRGWADLCHHRKWQRRLSSGWINSFLEARRLVSRTKGIGCYNRLFRIRHLK